MALPFTPVALLVAGLHIYIYKPSNSLPWDFRTTWEAFEESQLSSLVVDKTDTKEEIRKGVSEQTTTIESSFGVRYRFKHSPPHLPHESRRFITVRTGASKNGGCRRSFPKRATDPRWLAFQLASG